LQTAVKLSGYGINLRVAKLTKNGRRPIIFKRDSTIFIFAKQNADGRIKACRKAVARHLGRGQWISNVILQGSSLEPRDSQQGSMVALPEDHERRASLQFLKCAFALTVSQEGKYSIVNPGHQD